MSHSELTEYRYIEFRYIREPYLQSDVLCLAVICNRHALELQNMAKVGTKESLTAASLGCKCFAFYNKDREFYTFENKFVRDFSLKSVKGWKACAFKRYFLSIEIDEVLLTIKKHLDIDDD